MIKICSHCEQPFLENERRMFIPVERPYMNLIVHERCYHAVDDNLLQYLTENLERCYKIWKGKDK